jgi:hypothetical protein
VDDGVSGNQRGADQAAGHRDGIVPRRQQDGHAAGLGNGVVRGERVSAQAVAPVYRAELRVLLQGGNTGGNPSQCFLHRAAGFPCVDLRQLRRGFVEGRACGA